MTKIIMGILVLQEFVIIIPRFYHVPAFSVKTIIIAKLQLAKIVFNVNQGNV